MLLNPSDARIYNANYFTGTSLVEENNRFFLFACPENTKSTIRKFRGTCIFEFQDITSGILKLDEGGNLLLHNYLKPTRSNGGQSDYDQQNTFGGIVMPQMNYSSQPEIFQMFNTKQYVCKD